MLRFDKSDIVFFITVTLTELTEPLNPLYYLFVFTHIETKQGIKKIFSSLDDLSEYKYRYNKFRVTNALDFFGSSPVGHYVYKVYEQSDNDNTDTVNKPVVEEGRMFLSDYQNRFQLDEYTTQTDYKSYNG